MKKAAFIFIVLNMIFLAGFAQKYSVSGYIKDAETGESLIGANVLVKELSIGTVANVYGFYSLTLPEGNYTLVYSFLGYQSVTKQVELHDNITINIELGPDTKVLKEVVIESEKDDKNVQSVQMSVVKMPMETVKKIPALMGETDVLRAIQLLPGVQSGGEGSTGFFVRGGHSSQNMILLDEAPVYNASHLLGFFSVFNSDAIKDAQLYKGGIPAKYGGRLASVLDVRMKEGNNKKFHGSGGIGLISSRLTLEGPIVKDKASFIVSGRRTYGDLFLKFSKKENLKNSLLYFYDLNGKINWQINQKNRFFLSAYTGRDVLGVGDLFRMGWGNRTFTARWNHLFSDKIFSNLTAIYSNFDYRLGVPSGVQGFEWSSHIKNYSLKNDYTYYLNPQNTLRFGWISTLNEFLPAKFEPLEDNEILLKTEFPKRYTLESAIYLSNEQKLGGVWSFRYGVRASMFNNIGVDTIFNFDENFDTIPGNGYTAYAKGEFFNTYSGIEPRIAVKLTLSDQASLKTSYMKTYQYLHLASNSTNSAPIDIWIPSDPVIKPQIADQIALGYFRNFKNNMFETSAEVYYKWMENQVDFKDNAQILFNRLLDGEVRQGKGKSYGLELFVRKQQGDFTGWISYTLSKTTRITPGINDGETYLAPYDRRHNVSIVLSYDITQKLNASVNWVYYTGAPITTPTGRYEYNGMIVPVYSRRNEERMPDYHRLDFSLTYDFKKPERKFNSSLNLSVYNVYYRKNAFSINFQPKSDDPTKTEAVMTYLFGIIPAITYNFNF